MSISASRGFLELLREKLAGLAEVTPEQIQALQHHYQLLLRWNRVLNLTSIDSLEEAVERHYCESVFLAIHLPAGAMSIADIGSGGGFPGIPVAALRPDCRVTLVESHQRKAVFLREATRGMPNVAVVAKRAEGVTGRFDRAISRAVSYKDLVGVLKSLAPAADLLTGEEAPPAEMCFTWNSVISLPWGHSRCLRSGISCVSRGTG
ncbi:MAG TPA: 16S rRNA (guanine(527)-N(7))-methyltransferase RsmG [Bryobacteraceae bacterium]|jgi:16S rRNA (guanine(527)-N(7))-methyltransferase RsmG|nr:16S rRNA (guanine(527)-N(7))-methyltransferase RsmG [Bryobacteraceae bacterium]